MSRKATGNKGGRPSFKPTQEQREVVKAMTAYGIPQDQICRVIINPQTSAPLDEMTLRKQFRAEIDRASVEANAKVAETLFKKATGGGDWTKASDTAIIWWTKTRMGWKETVKQEISGADGGPIEVKDARTALNDILARETAARLTIEGTVEAERQPDRRLDS